MASSDEQAAGTSAPTDGPLERIEHAAEGLVEEVRELLHIGHHVEQPTSVPATPDEHAALEAAANADVAQPTLIEAATEIVTDLPPELGVEEVIGKPVAALSSARDVALSILAERPDETPALLRVRPLDTKRAGSLDWRIEQAGVEEVAAELAALQKDARIAYLDGTGNVHQSKLEKVTELENGVVRGEFVIGEGTSTQQRIVADEAPDGEDWPHGTWRSLP